MKGYSIRQKQEISNCILTGYYSAYYMNGGKKAKSPNELIKNVYKENVKQDVNEGLKQIERIKKLKGELWWVKIK